MSTLLIVILVLFLLGAGDIPAGAGSARWPFDLVREVKRVGLFPVPFWPLV